METHIKLKKIAEGIARTPMEIALAAAFKKKLRMETEKKCQVEKKSAPYRYEVKPDEGQMVSEYETMIGNREEEAFHNSEVSQ